VTHAALNRPADTTLAILAGGAGSRMGKPKSLLTLGGTPILEHLLRRLDFPGPTLLITAPGRERPPGHALFSAEVVDPILDAGPLIGAHAAAAATTTPFLLISAVDMPLVTLDGLTALLTALRTSPAHAAMFQTDTLQPLPLGLRVPESLPLFTARITQNQMSLKGVADDPRALVIPAPPSLPESFWTNLNHPEDLRQFR
jgi:molybdopterin-guanine dinucleotide biosynthesis protein A